MFNFLTPYLGTIKLVMYVIALLVGIGIGLRIDQGKIVELSEALGASRSALTSLSATVVEQNAAIDKLDTDTRAREKIAADAIQTAKLDAKQALNTAQQILLKRAPKGQDACAAASQDFSDELRAERGNPK